jgi:hypothetical protein
MPLAAARSFLLVAIIAPRVVQLEIRQFSTRFVQDAASDALSRSLA